MASCGRKNKRCSWPLSPPEEPARAPIPRPPDALLGREGEIAAIQHLHQQSKLRLVLDNLEQVTAAVDSLAETLPRCPGVRMLVTSREPLRIAGEFRVPAAPLALPPADIASRADVVASYPAIALCLARARRVRPDLDLSPTNVAAIKPSAIAWIACRWLLKWQRPGWAHCYPPPCSLAWSAACRC